MSWTYTYYLCRKDKETGMLYPFGPFDYNGRFFPASTTEDLKTDLYAGFYAIDGDDERKMMSEKLLKAIAGFSNDECKKFYEGESAILFKFLPFNELPKGDYVKRNYCLIDDIEEFEKKNGKFDGFKDFLTPEIYAKKLENEIKFGTPKPVKDKSGCEYMPHTMSEYSYYVWVDCKSAEYEAHCIRETFNLIKGDLSNKEISEEIFVLLACRI